jgi:hypothetical protein
MRKKRVRSKIAVFCVKGVVVVGCWLLATGDGIVMDFRFARLKRGAIQKPTGTGTIEDNDGRRQCSSARLSLT